MVDRTLMSVKQRAFLEELDNLRMLDLQRLDVINELDSLSERRKLVDAKVLALAHSISRSELEAAELDFFREKGYRRVPG